MTVAPTVAAPIHALLSHAIDYAGLFPPADLDLQTALNNYLGYRKSEDAWALGRFVIPANRLGDLPSHGEAPIEVSVLLGDGEVLQVDSDDRFRVGAVEIKGAPAAGGGARWNRYFEVPLDDQLEQRLAAIQKAGGLAKVRTGGTTSEAFPPAGALTRFLVLAAGMKLPFKATAGLHHPVRGPYRLTYQAGAPMGMMFGYLNLAIAALLAWSHAPEDQVEAALLESDPGSIRFDSDSILWNHQKWPTDLVAQVRRDFFHGFGSCSFREPLDELGLRR